VFPWEKSLEPEIHNQTNPFNFENMTEERRTEKNWTANGSIDRNFEGSQGAR